MNEIDIKKIYNLKIKEYLKHNKQFYEKSRPFITDKEYDKLKNEIINLENENLNLKNKNSPSHNVGFKPQNHLINISIKYLCYLYQMHSVKKI